LYFGTLYDPKFGAGIWDGLAWGPRYLLVILPFLTVAFGTLLQNLKQPESRRQPLLKFSIIVLSVVGFYVNLLGVLVWEMYGFGYGWTRDQLGKDSMWINMTWNPDYSQIGLHMKVLASNYLAVLSTVLAHHQIPWNNWLYRGLWPCSYDLYIYCKFGVTPVLILSGIIIVLSILILAEISDKYNTRYLVLRLNNYLRAKRT
jgi:hypothetical protein